MNADSCRRCGLVVLLVIVLSAWGCYREPKKKKPGPEAELSKQLMPIEVDAPLPPPAFHVSSGVGAPGTYQLYEDSDLQYALNKAGGASTAGISKVPPLVCLQRGRQLRWYFPLDFVTQGAGGRVPLQKGDIVTVTDFATLPIAVGKNKNKSRRKVNQTFEVTGMVASPGRFTTQDVSQDVSTLLTRAVAGPMHTKVPGGHVMIIQRDESAGVKTRYCLPLDEPFHNRAYQRIIIVEDDVFHFTHADTEGIFQRPAASRKKATSGGKAKAPAN